MRFFLNSMGMENKIEIRIFDINIHKNKFISIEKFGKNSIKTLEEFFQKFISLILIINNNKQIALAFSNNNLQQLKHYLTITKTIIYLCNMGFQQLCHLSFTKVRDGILFGGFYFALKNITVFHCQINYYHTNVNF